MVTMVKRTFGPVQDRIPANPTIVEAPGEEIYWCNCEEVRIPSQGKIWFLGTRCRDTQHASWDGREI